MAFRVSDFYTGLLEHFEIERILPNVEICVNSFIDLLIKIGLFQKIMNPPYRGQIIFLFFS